MIKQRNKLVGMVAVVLLCFCLSNRVNAQTPADIPGGSSAPGTVATSGDGPAEVPFDGGMSLMLAASGIGYAAKRIWGSNLRLITTDVKLYRK